MYDIQAACSSIMLYNIPGGSKQNKLECFKSTIFFRQRSLSAKNIHERVYETLPRSLKSEVLVKSRVEDPEIREERRKLIQVPFKIKVFLYISFYIWRMNSLIKVTSEILMLIPF